MRKSYTWGDLADLEPEWRRTSGEDMPFGFCVTPSIYDIMTERIRTNSQKPLDDYI